MVALLERAPRNDDGVRVVTLSPALIDAASLRLVLHALYTDSLPADVGAGDASVVDVLAKAAQCARLCGDLLFVLEHALVVTVQAAVDEHATDFGAAVCRCLRAVAG